MLIEVRCRKCNKLLGKLEGAAEIKCPRCNLVNHVKDLNIKTNKDAEKHEKQIS